MNAGRREEIEMVAQSLQMSGEFVPAPMLRELLAEVSKEQEFSGGYIGAGVKLVAERDNLRRELAAMTRERDELRKLIADVPTSNIIVLTEAGVRPDDSQLVRQWAQELFDTQLDMPEFISR